MACKGGDMKLETRMNKILNNPNLSNGLKVIKLENLALRCIAHSPIQAIIIEKYTELKKEVIRENPFYFIDVFNKYLNKGV